MDKDIVWIIVAVATGLLSLLGKSKKSTNTRTPTSIPQDTSAWDDIFDTKTTSTTSNDSPYIYETEVIDEKVEDVSTVSALKAERQHDNGAYTIKQATETGSESDDIADFSLRKAIIYSEILSPKFKEY